MVFKAYLLLRSCWKNKWRCLVFAIRRNILVSCDLDSFAWQNPTCLQRLLLLHLSVATSCSSGCQTHWEQRDISERLQASGPSSLVQMTSGPFPSLVVFSFFWKTGQRHRRVWLARDSVAPDVAVGSHVNLRPPAAFPHGAGRGSTRQLGSGGLGLRILEASATTR